MRCRACSREIAIAEGAPRICHTCQVAKVLAMDHLQAWRREFGGAPPDEAWFTTAWEYERDPGCDWAEYWDMVLELWELGVLSLCPEVCLGRWEREGD